MKRTLPICLLLLLLLSAHRIFSQVVVTFPTERAVFQRNNANEADVYIGGYITQAFQRVEARLTPRVPGEGEPLPSDGSWLTLDSQLSAGQFFGSVHLKGGWYQLEVRGVTLGGSISPVTTLARMGVGEVFVVAGQSNATGGDSNPNGPGAAHDQVNSVNFQNFDPGSASITPYSNVQLPCPEFVHLDANVKTAPFGNYAWCWGSFGDKIYQKFHVPVMIFNGGWSSTGVDNWKQSVDPNGVTVSAFGYTFPAGLPFGHLRLALNNYIAQLGVRAVLWHQGETDNYMEQSGDNTYNRYLSSLWDVINASRNLTGKPNLAWVVARASRFNVNGATRVSANVVNAQNELINNDGLYSNVFQGPETDPFYTIEYRHDEVHFRGDGVTPSPDGQIYSGLIHLANFWADKITPDFLNQSNPYAATSPPVVDATYASGGSQTTFTGPSLPGDHQYNWLMSDDCNNVQNTSQQWTVGAGLYKLKVIDPNRNTVYSPALNVTGTALPVTWQSFNARMAANGRVTLDWATASEMNASHFEVQRSTDSRAFTTVSIVNAAGNSRNTSSYHYEEEFLPKGMYYYRLKEVDADGQSDMTRIVSVRVEGNEMVRVFPNPATDMLVVESGNALNRIDIFNSAGKLVQSTQTGEKAIRLNIANLPKGLYVVSVDGRELKIVK
ncbi:Por secretion system C-terminal sorting domain-containing protein [Dyadobacter soli]|uniref:Por secretion system C-terminal sorting domain-containing protein n=1 Tax=Dyadobacter soli TaxID=659014 RepID=A0A1G6WZX2_9BACT|nr:T9SS type A sorting domain-containing protein [Dyadobacter soli]SDD70727.1 Por secretion system C-terminal sorting domain-containing protein [Dyadobacter soli]